jgi:16S rRNA G966 N2-methylase RsmD
MSPAISRDALIVVEHSSRTESAPVPDGMELIRQSTYGDTGISFYQFTR